MVYINPFIEKLVRIYPQGDRKGFLRLDMNENPEGLPEEMIELCKAQIDSELVASYPDRSNLIDLLSEYHQLPREYFCVTDGSEMAIKYIFEVFGETGKNVVTVNPTFEMYGVYCNMFGLNHIKYNIGDDFCIEVNNFVELIDNNTSIVSLINPNNPVGGIYNKEDIIKVVKRANECGALVIIDEAYHYFCNEDSIDLLNEFSNVIILRTFSKLYSIAACRIGYAISCPLISSLLNKVRPTFDTNSFALLFAENLIKDCKLREKLIANEKYGREYLIKKLIERNYKYYYGGGNYIFIKPNNDAKIIEKKLYNKRVLIKTYSNGILSGLIRVTTGSKKVMKEFWDIFYRLDCDMKQYEN